MATTAHLQGLLHSLKDTAASWASTDNQHSARRQRKREELTVTCGLRNSVASRMSRTTTISQEDENWIPIHLPFAVVGKHTQSREGAAKMTTTRHYVSSGYSDKRIKLTYPLGHRCLLSTPASTTSASKLRDYNRRRHHFDP